MARPKTAKPYHHGDLREALIVAGRNLMEEKGLRGFTLRECARRASVSHAAPAHHFPSIDALLAEIATRGFHELTEAMTAEARRSNGTPAGRLVAQGVGYMAFAAANSALFRLMFSLEVDQLEGPALAAAVNATHALHREAIEAVIPDAPADVQERMVDFARASVHGFITLVLEGQIGEKDSPRALKARGLAVLSAMVETVVRAGSS
ncbi:MAG: TetR/AcrR family transcriptional regulator [Reyranella sp.]|uniref:TetR/AcrR family transcriptional regulator n=1 Tax=Reyranella sp. TaxID=1929291 RepID=UPI003D148B05